MPEILNESGDRSKDCVLGVLIVENVDNSFPDKLKSVKLEAEKRLREKYGGLDRAGLKALHPLDTYISYYKKYGYSYHVLPQLESVIKGKTIPDVLPLVEAMFIAELDNMLLTAGHDLEKIEFPLKLSVSSGQEIFTAMSGREVTSVQGDFMISDQKSVISSILRGPDSRTAITELTSRAIYTVYAPAGVEAELVYKHLNDIGAYVKAFSKDAVISFNKTI